MESLNRSDLRVFCGAEMAVTPIYKSEPKSKFENRKKFTYAFKSKETTHPGFFIYFQIVSHILSLFLFHFYNK